MLDSTNVVGSDFKHGVIESFLEGLSEDLDNDNSNSPENITIHASSKG